MTCKYGVLGYDDYRNWETPAEEPIPDPEVKEEPKITKMKTESTRTIVTTRFLNIVEANFVDKAGNNKKWIFAQRPNNTTAVFVAAVVNTIPGKPQLVVIREYRVPIGDYVFSIPAGLVDPGEGAYEAARRELFEETGLSIKWVISTTPLILSSPGMTDEVASVVYVEAEGDISYAKHEVAEDIEVLLMDRTQVEELIKDTSAKFDAKAYMVFKQFAMYGEIG